MTRRAQLNCVTDVEVTCGLRTRLNRARNQTILPELVGGGERRQRRLSGCELMSCISLVSELRIIRSPPDVGGSRGGAVFMDQSGLTLMAHRVPGTVNEGTLKRSTR